jgi:hypothetical protein
MNRALFVHTWRSQRLKILVVFVALTVWGALLPIVYGTFGQTFKDIIASGLIPEELTQFGGGDIFSLSGSIALGAIHPISRSGLRRPRLPVSGSGGRSRSCWPGRSHAGRPI